MSLIDELKAGYKAGTFNSAPIYPGAVWKAKIVFPTTDLVGLTAECYFVRGEGASERLFDCVITTEINGANTEMFITAPETGTTMAKGCTEIIGNFELTETSTSETYLYLQSPTAVYSGVV